MGTIAGHMTLLQIGFYWDLFLP